MQYIDSLNTDWNTLKKNTVRFIGLCKESETLKHMVKTLDNCGDFLAFMPDDNGELKFRYSWFCRNRLCPMCIKRRSLKQYAEACKLVEAMPEGTWLHLVLTVPNVSFDDLGETISQMNKASSEFFRSKEIKRAFRGALRVLEVTYNSIRNDWHPHFHCLIFAPKSYCTNPKLYLKRDRLIELWSRYMRCEIKQVYITRIKDPYSALPEVVKYCFKPFTPDDTAGISEKVFYECIYTALHGRRVIQSYGLIRDTIRSLKIDIEGEADDGPPSVDTEGILLFRYNFSEGHYEVE
jgi:plasmid rolling circle replication initiator protein Rep